MVRPTKELIDLGAEAFRTRANDVWYEFALECHDKIILLPHFVERTEVRFLPLEGRAWQSQSRARSTRDKSEHGMPSRRRVWPWRPVRIPSRGAGLSTWLPS